MKKSTLYLFPLLLMLLSCSPRPSDTVKETKEAAEDTFELSVSSRALIKRVNDAVDLFNNEGEQAFATFKTQDSPWRRGDDYIFVIDDKGNMLVHTDTSLEGKNVLGLLDVGGKPIIKGLIETAKASSGGQGGWYHYRWPVPGGLFPRWKSSFVMPVTSSTGAKYIIGSGIYTDRMEREFVVDMVNAAAREIETMGESAFALFRDHTGPYLAKDAYVVVFSMEGIDLVNPAFPDLEGRDVMNLKDVDGKLLVKEMFTVANEKGAGWVDYMWPKPGKNVSTLKSAYVVKASHKGKQYIVSSGTYLADAPVSPKKSEVCTADSLIRLVDEAASVFTKRGEQAYPEFRVKGGRWFRDDTYFFVWSVDGIRKFHAANPELEGQDVKEYTDAIGRPVGQMMLDAGNSTAGTGWVHYFHPEPGTYFPIWKSSYVKRVRFPSGKSYLIGCGIYNMDMDEAIIEDLVERAAQLVEKKGMAAYPLLRDRKGAYMFMDTYIFMVSTEGVELFNAGMPSLEGKNIIDLKDLKGNNLVKDEIALALKQGKGWIDGYWYKPGDNRPALKRTFVKEVKCDGTTCIIGSGYYPE